MNVMIRTCTKANSQKMECRDLRKERRNEGEDDGRGGEGRGREREERASEEMGC